MGTKAPKIRHQQKFRESKFLFGIQGVRGLWISDLHSGSFFERKRKPGVKKRRSLGSIKEGSIKGDEERTRRNQGKHVWNFDAHDALGDCKA